MVKPHNMARTLVHVEQDMVYFTMNDSDYPYKCKLTFEVQEY